MQFRRFIFQKKLKLRKILFGEPDEIFKIRPAFFISQPFQPIIRINLHKIETGGVFIDKKENADIQPDNFRKKPDKDRNERIRSDRDETSSLPAQSKNTESCNHHLRRGEIPDSRSPVNALK